MTGRKPNAKWIFQMTQEGIEFCLNLEIVECIVKFSGPCEIKIIKFISVLVL